MSHYASIVHGKAFDLVTRAFGTRFKTYRKSPMLQVQPADLPLFAVYILRERRTPDGQDNQGIPKFHNDMTLGFSAAMHVETDDQDRLYEFLEESISDLDQVLLEEPSFTKLWEGCSRMDRMSQHSQQGETTLFEIRLEMEVRVSAWFMQRVEDTHFESVHVTVPLGRAGTQLARIWDVRQGEKPDEMLMSGTVG